MMIKESFALTATTADILAAPSRLAAMPGDGTLTIECSTTDSEGTNSGAITLQMPDGEVPFDSLIIPANGYSTADSVLHDDTALQFAMPVSQGGHVLVTYTETGTVLMAFFMFTFDF